MKFSRLIALAADREIQRDPGLLGVRLSPVSLKKDQAPEIVTEAIKILGKKAFVAISVPSVPFEESGRVCVAPDARAAERATAWRNTVRVVEGEHILYVSVEPHGKAGGLQDCLYPLDERALRTTLIEWAQDGANGLPDGLADALVESGVTETVSAAALCSFVSGVLRDSKKVSGWEAAGQNLPILGFAADARLRASDAAQRLRINADLVMKAAAAERRHQGLAARSDVVAGLVEALQQSRGEDLSARLASVDLGVLTTKALEKIRRPAKKRAVVPPTARPKVAVAKSAKKNDRTRDSEHLRNKRPSQESALDNALGLDGKHREAALARSAATLLQGTRGHTEPTVSALSGATPAAGSTPVAGGEVWSAAMHRREFGEPSALVPDGLAEIVTELAQRDGRHLIWEPQRDSRSCLVKLPSTLTITEQAFEVPAQLAEAFALWAEARRAVVRQLMPDGKAGALLAFLGAPLAALGDADLRRALATLLDRSRVLYAAAARVEGQDTPRALLSLDTAHIRSKAGDTTLVIGPFHPLWLGQLVSRFDAMLNEPTLEKEGRRLLARSLTEAPAAPQFWPTATAPELMLARPEGGLIVYELEPACADSATLSFVGDRLVSRYLDLLPHARLGLRIAVDGDGAAAFVEGVAGAASRTPDLRRVEILYSGSSLNLDGRFTAEQIALGRIVLNPMPDPLSPAGAVAPHLVVRMAAPPTRPDEEEPGVPDIPVHGAGSGLLPTEFQVSKAGLRARMPLDGHPVLEAVEAVHAFARGRMPQRSFVSDATVTLLSSVFPPPPADRGAWHVALGRRMGRRPHPGSLLLAHDRISEATQFVVVSDNINPLSRALEGGFRRLGVNDLRPSILRVLATRLAEASSTGLLSLSGSDDHLIAAGLLGLSLRADFGRESSCVLAPIERAAAMTLLGRPSGGDEDSGATILAVGPNGKKLRAVLGFATLSPTADASLVRGQLEGGLAERFGRLLSVLTLARDSSTLGGLAAREALNWLLWPAIAASEVHSKELVALVEGIGKGTDVAIELVCLAPPGNPLGGRGEVRLGKIPVRTIPLDLPLVERLVLAT